MLLLHIFPTGFVLDEDFDEVDALTPGRVDHGRGALRVWIERRTCQKSHALCAVHDFEVFVAYVGEFDLRENQRPIGNTTVSSPTE